MKFLLCTLLVTVTVASPVTQQVYSQQQFAPQQYPQQQYAPQQYPQQQYAQATQIQYRPLSQPQYLANGGQTQAQPVHEQSEPQPAQYYSRQSLAQPLLGNVDRQIQKAANHIAGPDYAQQIQSLQLQGRAVQVQDQIQRNALRLATAPRALPLQYQRALQSGQPAPKLLQQDSNEGEEQYNSNPSYQFGFDVKDDLYTNYHTRKEQREGDKITGSYSVVDSDGFLRTVTYTADPKEGFKAEVNRQPTDIVVKIPQQPQQKLQQQYQIDAQPQKQQPQYYQVPVTIGGQQLQQDGQDQDKQQQQRVVYQYQ